MLKIKDLKVNIDTQRILNGIDLEIKPGETHIIMGPNGSGKSTLANVLLGHPKFSVTGDIIFENKKINKLKPEERAKRGLFMSFQYPREIAGLSFSYFLFNVYNNLNKDKQLDIFEFNEKLKPAAEKLAIRPELLNRDLNFGLSGGEKKKMEMLQLSVLTPKLAILDETDSGLDVDALQVIAQAVNDFKNKERGVLIITHYNRILKYIKPDIIHILVKGRIVKSGDAKLAVEIEKNGYQEFN